MKQTVRLSPMLLALMLSTPVHGALRYDVTYAGIFSAMQSLDIADAILSEESAGPDGLIRGDLTISSVGHDAIEAVYPFRYRVRSLYRDDGTGTVAFEHYKQTRRVKHEVFVADPVQGKLLEYRPGAAGAALPAPVAAYLPSAAHSRLRGDGAVLGSDLVFDRLSLIQHIRKLPLVASSRFEIPVTDGDDNLVYHVQVVMRETQRTMGRDWDTWRLRLDAFAENGEAAHRPVYLWLEAAPGHRPIKVEARHAIGRFSMMLAELDVSAGPRHLPAPVIKKSERGSGCSDPVPGL